MDKPEEETINGNTEAEFAATWSSQRELQGWIVNASRRVFSILEFHPEKQQALNQKEELQEFYRRYAWLKWKEDDEKLKAGEVFHFYLYSEKVESIIKQYIRLIERS